MAKSLATVIKILRAAHRGGAHDFRFAGNSERVKALSRTLRPRADAAQSKSTSQMHRRSMTWPMKSTRSMPEETLCRSHIWKAASAPRNTAPTKVTRRICGGAVMGDPSPHKSAGRGEDISVRRPSSARRTAGRHRRGCGSCPRRSWCRPTCGWRSASAPPRPCGPTGR